MFSFFFFSNAMCSVKLFLKIEPHFWKSLSLLNFLRCSYHHRHTIYFAYIFSLLSFCFHYTEVPPVEIIFLFILKTVLSTVPERVLILDKHLLKKKSYITISPGVI